MKKIGLYIHIPFCNHICSYCDFCKRVSSDDIKEKYFQALINEIEFKKNILKKYQIETIYIGGGTPSSISLTLLENLFKKLNQLISLSLVKEFTFECNIEDITYDLGKLLSKYHINRISIGIESLNSKILNIIGRNVNLSDISLKMRILRNFGLKSINFDYIYGIEPLTIDDTINDIKQLISLNPTHISCYSLILEEKTILYHQYQKGNFTLMDEEKETKMYDEIRKTLLNYGYKQYEISNFAIESYESTHNIIYWSNEEYLGIGLNSSSYLENYRFKNIDHLFKYINYFQNEKTNDFQQIFKDTTENIENLSKKEIIEYEVILGLRLIKGINLKTFFTKYQVQIEDIYPNIKNLIETNYLQKDETYLRINPKYLYLQNQILLKIFA